RFHWRKHSLEHEIHISLDDLRVWPYCSSRFCSLRQSKRRVPPQRRLRLCSPVADSSPTIPFSPLEAPCRELRAAFLREPALLFRMRAISTSLGRSTAILICLSSFPQSRSTF